MTDRRSKVLPRPVAATRGQVAAAPVHLSPGELAGEYEIQHHIADGGMASVYAAKHPLIGKVAAVKVLTEAMAHNAVAVERFLHEAQAVNRIQHPNLVDIFAFGRLHDGRQYLVMEYLEGATLQSRLDQGHLDAEEAYDIVDQMCDALEATHAQRIAHLDLKPANILLLPGARGTTARVKILDFGIAKLLEAEPGSPAAKGEICCTPEYASPEQAQGLATVDERSDIYSLGIVLYEMVCGVRPFEDETPLGILYKRLRELPPAPSQFQPDIPIALERLLLAMLAREPENRPTIGEVRARIGELRSTPMECATHHASHALAETRIEARPLGSPSARRKRYRRSVAVVAAGVLACLAVYARHSRGNPLAPTAAAIERPAAAASATCAAPLVAPQPVAAVYAPERARSLRSADTLADALPIVAGDAQAEEARTPHAHLASRLHHARSASSTLPAPIESHEGAMMVDPGRDYLLDASGHLR